MRHNHTARFALAWMLVILGHLAPGFAQDAPAVTSLQVLTNREIWLTLNSATSQVCQVEASTELSTWTPLIILSNASGTLQHTDTAAPFISGRFYRVAQMSNTLSGDCLETTNGLAVIHPVNHATMVITWNGVTICVDPADGYSTRLKSLPSPDLILVTHEHSDHFSTTTINAIQKTNTILVVSKSVYAALSGKMKTNAVQMTNGATAELLGVGIRAIPAYNSNHPKGNGNGYVLTLGGKTLYICGDTDDIAEMRALTGIDVAFICMDGNYNMTMTKAASAVREFKPKIVFPYHYLSQKPPTFKNLVGTDLGIEVRLRKWE